MIKPWRVTGSRIVVEDRWIKLRADTCVRDDGLVIEPFYILEQASWVNILALTADNHVVLTQEYRHGAARVVMGLPGGVVDPADATPRDAAARELLEETGYVCDEVIAIGDVYANWASQTNKIHLFIGLGARLAGKPQLDTNEQINVELRPWDEVRAPGFLQQSFHVAGVHYAEKYLAARHPHQA